MAAHGELGQLIRAFDWSATPLGPMDQWPQSLKTSVSLILNAQMPMWLGWGPDMVFFYNDAYIQVLSQAKHPWALGRPAREVWAEIWDICGPLADRVFRDGQAPFVEDVQLFMDRGGGFLEEVYYSFSYSPIEIEDGSIGGLFCPNSDVTAKILNARRLRTLSDLAAKALVEKTTAAAAATAAATLGRNREDIPFAVLYLTDGDAPGLALEQVVGIASGHEQLRAHWPLEHVMQTGASEVVAVPPNDVVPLGLADQPVQQAIVIPIVAPSHGRTFGVLVAGVNPTRRLDAEYRTFYELVATQVGTAVQNALSLEEEKRRADALAELDRVKTTFFSNVSHEFRTPLTLMLGPTEDALDSPERVLRGESLETVYRNELRLLRLVNALLDFSRIEAGRMQANYETVDLTELTADLASGFRAAIEKAGLRFDVAATRLPHAVLVDRQMWEKIVLNLLSNALKFTLEGSIQVTLETDGSDVVLTVADTGTGIPADQLPRLFERFHRIENRAARTHEGTGIGLALVHDLAKLHGGSVDVASVVGQGSRFTVRIPMVRAPQTALVAHGASAGSRMQAAFVSEAQRWTPASTQPVADVPPDGRGYVLLADDNADMREYVQRLLEVHWNVVAVRDGTEALAAARARRPDLILSDIMMPGLDGFALLQALRSDEKLQHVPVILLSARAGSEAHVEGLAAGADDYLVKPFSARELVARVRTHLALGRARQAATEHFEELYALLMQVPATITVRRGPELRCVFQNASAQKLGDQRGTTLAEIWPDRSDFRDAYERVMRTGETIIVRELSAERYWADESRARRRYWDATYSPLRLPDGTIDGVISIAFEVTDRVEARAQLDLAETRRRLAFDAANVGTWHVDLVQNTHTRDDATNRIFGLDDDNDSTQPLADLIARVHPTQRTRIENALRVSIERATPFDEEFQVVRPDGTTRWVHGSGQVSHDEEQEPVAFTGVVADITTRREAEEQSELARMRLEAALTAGDIGTYFWDVRTNDVEHDASVKRLFGFTDDRKHSIDEYTQRIHEADRAAWLNKLAASVRDGADFTHEYRVLLPDGRTRWLLDKAQMNRDTAGIPLYMTGAIVDITEQRRLAEAALAASRAKDEFLAMLGHELRNPLAPMTTAIELMKLRGGELPKEIRVIERQVHHLGRLVDDLLDISRLTRGLIELKRQRVEIKDSLQKALEMASPLIEQKCHRISLVAPAGLVVDGDPTRLAQIFSNLLTNAARYTNEQGRIDVAADRTPDGRVRITVTDTGMGIRPDMLTKIFELFEQGVNTGLSRGEGGLGIGLALVRSLVHMHGGEVAARSEGPGKGSTFEVLLPAIQEAVVAQGAAQPLASPALARRILVVDDNEDAAFLLSEMLRTIGHDVLVAHDAAQALAVAGDYQPDTAILDIGLPAMDGYELGRTLRESGRGPRTMIALTGYGQERDRTRSQQAGFDAHLVKPVSFAKLVEALGQ